MQRSIKVKHPEQNSDVSQKISNTQALIKKIKYDYHIAAMLVSSAYYTIEKMSGEMDAVTEQLTRLTEARDGAVIQILHYEGRINATDNQAKQG